MLSKVGTAISVLFAELITPTSTAFGLHAARVYAAVDRGRHVYADAGAIGTTAGWIASRREFTFHAFGAQKTSKTTTELFLWGAGSFAYDASTGSIGHTAVAVGVAITAANGEEFFCADFGSRKTNTGCIRPAAGAAQFPMAVLVFSTDAS